MDYNHAEEESRKGVSRNFFIDAGKAITRVEAKLNKIRVFGHYEQAEINRKIGPFDHDETPTSKKKNISSYDTKVIKDIKHFSGIYLTVLINNKRPFYPQCSIEIHPKNDISLKTHKAFLIWLNEKLPNLSVSKVEYAIDQFCSDPFGASVLFEVDKRYLHLNHRQKGRIFGDDIKNEGRVNSLLIKIGRYHKVSERGPEDKKQDKKWLLKDVDRVRLLHRVNRIKLKKYGIYTLENLISNPRFSVLNLYRWRFMQFRKLRKLPKLWQPHLTDDKGGHGGSLKLDFIRSRRKTENVSDYVTSYKEIVRIEFRVNRAMKSFDWEWYNI